MPHQGWPERTLTIGQIKPIRYMVKGFWAHSFMVLAGQPGIGKTTAIISLCMVMAGLQAKDCELTATKKRKTIIVTEDSDQVERTLTGYARHYGISASALSDWFVIIDAKRSNVKDLLMLAHNVIKHTVDNVRPLLVLDTANATMDIDNENDNSEVGAYIAALKQTIYIQLDTPVCIITHTNKTISKSDSDATARGASAFTGDATLTGILFEDETKTRYMRLVKTRYQPNFREIKFQSDVLLTLFWMKMAISKSRWCCWSCQPCPRKKTEGRQPTTDRTTSASNRSKMRQTLPATLSSPSSTPKARSSCAEALAGHQCQRRWQRCTSWSGLTSIK